MLLDYNTLENLRENHAAWRLLCASHVAFVASFLHRVFIVPNARNLSQEVMVEELNKELYTLNEKYGPEKYKESAKYYLDDWSGDEKGWLRKFYVKETDDPHYDLTPATEKALLWLEGLSERSFIGTESRLMTAFELLRKMSGESQVDPAVRINALQRRRDEIDKQIAQIVEGKIELLDETSLKDIFQQFRKLSRELLADFREVEDNLRDIDRRWRDRIVQWEGGKGKLIGEILGEREGIIENSDQGKSVRAFWRFLGKPSRKDEFNTMLEHVLSLPAIQSENPESRLREVHVDWAVACAHTLTIEAKLAKQLSKFLDDRSLTENRRIKELLLNIKRYAVKVRENLKPDDDFMVMNSTTAEIEILMDRRLFRGEVTTVIERTQLKEGVTDGDSADLFSQEELIVDELLRNIREELEKQDQITLGEVVQRHPLRYGLHELLIYMQLASDWPTMTVHDEIREQVSWEPATDVVRQGDLSCFILKRE